MIVLNQSEHKRSINVFSGVHSIERSAQEDTLLVLFNAAISNLVCIFHCVTTVVNIVTGLIPEQLCAQSRYYRPLPIIPVQRNCLGPSGEPIVVPINTHDHYQGRYNICAEEFKI